MTRDALQEGWYLMSTAELEQELDRWRGATDRPPTGAVPLSTEEALALKRAGNVPDENGRWLRLVLHVDDERALADLPAKRLRFEPDVHDAPVWRREGSKPVNVVPLRLGEVKGQSDVWWTRPEVADLEREWQEEGTIAGVGVPAEYRSFVFKTVLALQAAGASVSRETIVASLERWLSPADAARIEAALENATE